MIGLIERYKARQAAAKFTKAIMGQYWPDCDDIDGSTIHELAVKCGIFVKTEYDPEIHGECDYDAEPGDDWYVLRPGLV